MAEAGEEGKDGKRIEEDTYRNIDTNLPSLNVLGEFTRRAAALGEDGDAITVLVCVDDIDGFVERVDVQADKDGSKDFFLVARHVFRHIGNDCRSDLSRISISNPSLFSL